MSNNLLDFLSKCLRIDPETRITVDHALNHPFINMSSPQYLNNINLEMKVPPIEIDKRLEQIGDEVIASLKFYK
jgi:serine/threonine protein kinase